MSILIALGLLLSPSEEVVSLVPDAAVAQAETEQGDIDVVVIEFGPDDSMIADRGVSQ